MLAPLVNIDTGPALILIAQFLLILPIFDWFYLKIACNIKTNSTCSTKADLTAFNTVKLVITELITAPIMVP